MKKILQALSRAGPVTNAQRDEKKGSDCSKSSDKQIGQVVSIRLDGMLSSERDQEI
jgi:hypothetical protein